MKFAWSAECERYIPSVRYPKAKPAMNLIPHILIPGHAARERQLLIEEKVAAPASVHAELGIRHYMERIKVFAHSQSGYQIGLILAVWFFILTLQWDNDGLWFQPDSAMHALNGIFWGDFLRAHPLNPLEYAQRYFVRYPGINPTSYPPLFYWLEAIVFGILGPSPFVAKGLVLAFALLGALYTRMWFCRYIHPRAGYLAAVVLLLPTIVTFSHGVMLNVPSASLMMAGLYHTRRWLDEPQSKQLIPATLLSVASILCYFPALVVVPIMLAWIILEGRLSLLIKPRSILVAALSAVCLLPPFLLAMQWSTSHVDMTSLSVPMLSRSYAWLYYPSLAPVSFSWPILGLAGLGMLTGLLSREHRRTTILLISWLLIEYVFLSYLKAKESRYILPLGYPLLGLAAVAITLLATLCAKIQRPAWSRPVFGFLTMGLVAWLGFQAWATPSRGVLGMRELTAFLAKEMPKGSVFYDGRLQGLFTFCMRAADPAMQRGVVRGDKLLYNQKMSGARVVNLAASPEDVLETLRTRSGCEYLALESDVGPKAPPPSIWIRELVKQEPFEFVRSFQIHGPSWVKTIDIYRFTVAIEHPATLDLPIPTAGAQARMQAAPL